MFWVQRLGGFASERALTPSTISCRVAEQSSSLRFRPGGALVLAHPASSSQE